MGILHYGKGSVLVVTYLDGLKVNPGRILPAALRGHDLVP